MIENSVDVLHQDCVGQQQQPTDCNHILIQMLLNPDWCMEAGNIAKFN